MKSRFSNRKTTASLNEVVRNNEKLCLSTRTSLSTQTRSKTQIQIKNFDFENCELVYANLHGICTSKQPFKIGNIEVSHGYAKLGSCSDGKYCFRQHLSPVPRKKI